MNKKKENWYNDFFGNFYLPYFFSYRDKKEQIHREVNFILQALKLTKGAKLLDLACGPGRHAIGLGKKGLDVVGLDFNKKFIKLTKEKAKKSKINIEFICEDMRTFNFSEEFDAVISMYTSFGYFINEADNIKALQGVARSLKPGGLFLLDLPNRNWIIKNISPKRQREVSGKIIVEEGSFNEKSGIYNNNISIFNARRKLVNKTATHLHLYELGYLKRELKRLNFQILEVFGGYNIREEYNKRKSKRMIILAKRKGVV